MRKAILILSVAAVLAPVALAAAPPATTPQPGGALSGAAAIAVTGVQGPDVAYCNELVRGGALWGSPLPGWTPLQVAQRCRTLLINECHAQVRAGQYGLGPFAGWPLWIRNQQCAELSRDLAHWIQFNFAVNPWFSTATGTGTWSTR